MEYRVSYSFSKTKLKENFFMTVMLMLSNAVCGAFLSVSVYLCACASFLFLFLFLHPIFIATFSIWHTSRKSHPCVHIFTIQEWLSMFDMCMLDAIS